MGNRCCSPELDKYQIKLQDKADVVQQKGQHRKGFPSQKIAIKVSDLNRYFTSQSQLQEINRMIFFVVEDERKKFKQTMRVNRQPILDNKLKQPYFIPSLGVFYIGEWIFNQFLNDNVPGGIGRMYEDGSISQGIFKTFLVDAEAILPDNAESDQQLHNMSQNSIVYKSRVSQDHILQRSRVQQSKIEKLLKADRQKLVNDFKFEIKLDGQGRISSTQENGKVQITLEGEFLQGKLNGRGTLKMITNEQQSELDNAVLKRMNKKVKDQQRPSSTTSKNSKLAKKLFIIDQEVNKQKQISRKVQYNYIGFWKEGNKHGKGVEKVQYFFKESSNQVEKDMDDNIMKYSRKTISSQSFRYQGSFHQNSKHGKGNLTFLGTNRHQHEVQKDMQKMQKQLISQGQNIKSQAAKQVILRRLQQKLIQQKLANLPQSTKQKLKKKHLQIKQTQRLLIFDPNFNIERKYRTIFNQNYIGDFKEGQMDGHGVYTWPNGKTYKGRWEANMMSGRGEFYWPDGTYYLGEYREDERNGEGMLAWNVFKRYRGDWAFGMRHGYGQSIQLIDNEQPFPNPDQPPTKKLLIKGHIWNRDKAIKPLFEQQIIFKSQQFEYLKIEADHQYEQQISNKNNKKVEEITKLDNFKQAATHNIYKFSNTLSRFVGGGRVTNGSQ